MDYFFDEPASDVFVYSVWLQIIADGTIVLIFWETYQVVRFLVHLWGRIVVLRLVHYFSIKKNILMYF